MNHKKIIIGLLVAIVVAVVILFSISAAKAKKAKEAKEKEAAQPAATPTPTTGTPTPAALAAGYPITYNVRSERAKALQIALGMKGSEVDGIIGKNTLKLWNETIAPKKAYTTQFEIANDAQLKWALDEIAEARRTKSVAQGAAVGIVDGWFTKIPALKIV